MKKRRIIALVLSAVLVVGLAAGCSQTEETKSKETSGQEESKEPVTLRFSWWGGDERNEATLKVIENFEKEYPWVTIEPEFGGDDGYLEKLSTALAGGQAADIIQNGPGWMPNFVSKGDFFIDFNEYADKIDLSGFSQEYLENISTYNEKLLGLPSGVATTSLLVNKTLSDKIKLDFSGDVTWEGLIEMGKTVQAYNPEMYLLNIDTNFLVSNVFRPYIMQLTGKPFVDDESKALSCSEEQLVQVLEYIESIYDNGVTQPAGETASFAGSHQTNPKWMNGEYVCIMTNSSQINNATAANETAEFTIVNMPHMSDKSSQKNDGYYTNPPQLMCVNKNSEHIEEAVLFLDYFFNNEEAAVILKDLRSVPPTESARAVCEEKGLISSLVIEAVNMGLEQDGINEMGLTTDAEVEAVIKTMIESVSYRESTAQEAADSGIEMLKNILSEK